MATWTEILHQHCRCRNQYYFKNAMLTSECMNLSLRRSASTSRPRIPTLVAWSASRPRSRTSSGSRSGMRLSRPASRRVQTWRARVRRGGGVAAIVAVVGRILSLVGNRSLTSAENEWMKLQTEWMELQTKWMRMKKYQIRNL